MTTAYKTDHYEFTARQAAKKINDQNAVFDLYTRRLPEGRAFGVVAGMSRLIKALHDFKYTNEFVTKLIEAGVISAESGETLKGKKFEGKVTGLQDGDLYFPNTPILTVEGKYGDILVVETLCLSILNHDSAIASAAARMKIAAGNTPLIEAGARRTHDDAAQHATEAAYISGFDVSSNLAALGVVPTAGTVMHAFILAFETEEEAFEAQFAEYGAETTFLIDTYDIEEGINTAIRVCKNYGEAPRAIRIDSGDLCEEAFKARKQLDNAGCESTKIIVSGDMDEYSISALKEAGAPVDMFQVGTAVVTGSGHPAAGMVYKLVAIERENGWHSVEKKSLNKRSYGGHKKVIGTTVYHKPEPFDSSGEREVLYGPDENGSHQPFVTYDADTIELARKRLLTNLDGLSDSMRSLNAEATVVEFINIEEVGQ